MNRNEIPVLILGYKRPEFTKRLIDALRPIAPKKIYYRVDGIRHVEDKTKNLEVIELLKEIDWECKVESNISEQNLGLKQAIISGIDWVFSKEDCAIILEDDCIPSPEFFEFCSETLPLFQDEDRIMQISGNNFVGPISGNGNRWYFSALNDIWGWATWKKSWSHFERTVPNEISKELQVQIREYFDSKKISNWFIRYLVEARSENSQVWSTQWTLTMIKNRGLTVVPQVNLVENIGFYKDATHMTGDAFQEYARFPIGKIEATSLPTEIKVSRTLDEARFSLICRTDPNLKWQVRAKNYLRDSTLKLLPTRFTTNIRMVKNFIQGR